MTQGAYTEAKTGITFVTWTAGIAPGEASDGGGPGPFTFGLVLPADAATANATEYIGYLVGPHHDSPVQRS